MNKLKTFNHWDYVSVLVAGILMWWISGWSLTHSGWDLARQWVGIPFVLLGPGYLLTTLIWPRDKELGFLERMLYSFGFSLFLSYPAGFLNVLLIEGQANIYQSHLMGVLGFLLLFSVIMVAWGIRLRKQTFNACHDVDLEKDKRSWMVFGLIGILALYFRLTDLSAASVNQDEFEIGYRAYDLVDGMQAGRRAFFLSGTDHSPLGFYIWHMIYAILSPDGYTSLSDAMLRIPNVIMGMLVLFGSGVFSKKLFKSHTITLLLVLFLAVDQYSIFGSKLGIPQDLAYLTFFMLLAVGALYKYWDKPTRKNLIMAGVFTGFSFLVKFSSILLAPLVILGWIVYKHKNKVKDLAIFTGVTLATFSPVIVYNLATFKFERYLDVSFAKIARMFGMEVNSLMPATDEIYGAGTYNVFQSWYELKYMLMDQWNVFMFGAVVVSVLWACWRVSQKRDALALWVLLGWIGSALLFFGLNGFRAYYAAFLSVPAFLLVAYGIHKFKVIKELKIIVVALLLAYSGWYSFNTHAHLSDHENVGERGRLGYEKVMPAPFARPHAVSTISFLNDKGLAELRDYVEAKVTPQDAIFFDPAINNLLIRWYFETGEDVKRFYLEDEYQDKYQTFTLDQWQNDDLDWIEGEIYFILLPMNASNFALSVDDWEREVLSDDKFIFYYERG
jgi:hypothetical protein